MMDLLINGPQLALPVGMLYLLWIAAAGAAFAGYYLASVRFTSMWAGRAAFFVVLLAGVWGLGMPGYIAGGAALIILLQEIQILRSGA
jgi:hypothetical protein